MGGWPVWLASASLHDRRGKTRLTPSWDAATMAKVSASLTALLDGVGDAEHEREFRMQVTLCRHRAVTDEEYEALPDWWHAEPAQDIAGGPVEVLWHRNVPELASTQPCEHPGRTHPDPRDWRIWIPTDCGTCEPCRARAECRTLDGAAIARPW